MNKLSHRSRSKAADGSIVGGGVAMAGSATLVFPASRAYSLRSHLVVARMVIFARKFGFAVVSTALVLALLPALCLGGRAAHAQAAPLTYWTPGWPLGFGGSVTVDQAANTYANFPSFSASDGSRFSYTRYNFSNGWFIGNEAGGFGLNGAGVGLSRLSQDDTFGGLRYQGVQFGYDLQKAGGAPVTFFGGIDTLKYNPGIGSPFDSTSSTLSGYSAHAGVEFRPTSNLSLSLGVGYTQQPDINSALLPGASPFAFGGRR
jgi:opacity protein-like surface antigen